MRTVKTGIRVYQIKVAFKRKTRITNELYVGPVGKREHQDIG
jgi:hypothetical protein